MRGQPAHYLEHDELIAGNNYSYLKLSEKLKKDRKTKKKERTEERLRKRKCTHSNASTPLEQIFFICGIFFLVGKDLMRQKGVRDEFEINEEGLK